MSEKNTYKGLSIDESITAFQIQRDRLYKDYQYPLSRLLEQQIIDRIRAIDTRTLEQLRDDTGCEAGEEMFHISLPWHINLVIKTGNDERKEERFYDYIDNGANRFASACVILGRYDYLTGDYDTYDVRDTDELIYVYRRLKKMGFFDETKTSEFEV